MVAYHRSLPGRLLACALALPLLAGAVSSFNAVGLSSYALPIIGAIGLAFFAVGLGVEDYPSKSFAAILTLPVALFLYLPLVGIIVPMLHEVVYVMAVAGCALLTTAVRPGFPSPTDLHVRRERTV